MTLKVLLFTSPPSGLRASGARVGGWVSHCSAQVVVEVRVVIRRHHSPWASPEWEVGCDLSVSPAPAGTTPVCEDIGRSLLTYGRHIPLAEWESRIAVTQAPGGVFKSQPGRLLRASPAGSRNRGRQRHCRPRAATPREPPMGGDPNSCPSGEGQRLGAWERLGTVSWPQRPPLLPASISVLHPTGGGCPHGA